MSVQNVGRRGSCFSSSLDVYCINDGPILCALQNCSSLTSGSPSQLSQSGHLCRDIKGLVCLLHNSRATTHGCRSVVGDLGRDDKETLYSVWVSGRFMKMMAIETLCPCARKCIQWIGSCTLFNHPLYVHPPTFPFSLCLLRKTKLKRISYHANQGFFSPDPCHMEHWVRQEEKVCH